MHAFLLTTDRVFCYSSDMLPVSGHRDSSNERQWFATTHWSVVLTAAGTDSSGAALALERLCSSYWYPLYSHVRRRGYDAESAKDLTQEFFARLIEKNWLQN